MQNIWFWNRLSLSVLTVKKKLSLSIAPNVAAQQEAQAQTG
jgi:hypothetical protein